MNIANSLRSLTACAFVLVPLVAGANQMVGPVVTGHVTSVSGTEWITVDGKAYRIESGSPAAAAVPKLAPGQLVDVQLNGPTNTAATAVVNVVPHSGIQK